MRMRMKRVLPAILCNRVNRRIWKLLLVRSAGFLNRSSMPAIKKKNKKTSVFSHQFIITNHGDIVSCICMLFMIGLLFKTTQKLAGVFVAPQHNVTEYNNDTGEVIQTLYTVGKKDICTIFFYTLAWIVVHAIIQEYILDKINRKFHLSITKISRFNNLGGHIPFYFASAAWGADIILKENLLPKLSNLWHDYPHTEMTLLVKFYFLLQIAYWIHCFPELYFLKVKKENLVPRINVYLQYLVILIPAYICNFTRLALVCLVIHYFVEFLFNTIKIMNYMGKTETSKNTLMLVWALLYIIVRIVIVILSIVTIWIGLPKQDSSDKYHIVPNFNKKPLRVIFLAGIIMMQGWLTWLFISNQVHYWTDIMQTKSQKSAKKKEVKKKAKEQKKAVQENESDNETPLVNGKEKVQ